MKLRVDNAIKKIVMKRYQMYVTFLWVLKDYRRDDSWIIPKI